MIMSNEGNLWKVQWKKDSRGYRVFLTDDPKFQATAKRLDDAIEQLEERVTEERDDPVPHFEWLNPLPHPVGVESRDFVYVLTGHHRVDVENVEESLEKPRCARCHNYSGPRTSVPLRLNASPDGDLPFTQFGGQLCSEKLAQLLKLSECDDLRLLPIIITGQETFKFLELRTRIAREFVAKKEAPSRNAFRCRACGATVVTYFPDEADYFQFVAASALPRPVPTVFAIGSDYSIELAVSKALRQQVISSDEFKNVTTRKIGILDDDQAVPADVFFKISNMAK